MNISHLLAHRDAYLARARLANLACAHEKLRNFADRLARAGITGSVRLRSTGPDDEPSVPTLAGLDSHPAVIEEHFTDEDAVDLVDVLRFLRGEEAVDLVIAAPDIPTTLLAPIQAELRRAGVSLGEGATAEGPPHRTAD
jgi:hypothetical protein